MKQLFLRQWDYNSAVVLDKLSQIVSEKGGKVLNTNSPVEISNRNVDDDMTFITRFGEWRYIKFTLDDIFYYLQIEDNPLFDWLTYKTPVINDRYSKDVCAERVDFDVVDVMMPYGSMSINDATATLVANKILMSLEEMPCGEKYREKERVMVPNLYNEGFHYEIKFKEERYEKI